MLYDLCCHGDGIVTLEATLARHAGFVLWVPGFAENLQIQTTWRHVNDRSPSSTNVRKAVPLPRTSMRGSHRILPIEIEYIQQSVLGERVNRHIVSALACTATWVNNGGYDEF